VLPAPKPLQNLAFSDDNSNSDEDHGQQDGDNFDCDWTFEGSFSSFEPHLLTEGNTNDLVCAFNLSKKQAELFISRLKRMESSPPRYCNVWLLKTPK
jgi:hypothetical protein